MPRCHGIFSWERFHPHAELSFGFWALGKKGRSCRIWAQILVRILSSFVIYPVNPFFPAALGRKPNLHFFPQPGNPGSPLPTPNYPRSWWLFGTDRAESSLLNGSQTELVTAEVTCQPRAALVSGSSHCQLHKTGWSFITLSSPTM